ncbi:hypothetical protein [Balneola vulgaris]|uniref:hypothetical protein n=1 Tax=Balneola vulgaris TaxID=287535 RepID=UPI0003756E89|nr:hypothetical protein [Balneola vulgaris]
MAVPPHKLHPDILHWKEGDEIEARNVNISGFFSLLSAIEVGNVNRLYLFKAITDDGLIIVMDKETGQLYKVLFKKFIKKATNISLLNRKIECDIDNSQGYMELMKTFQKAYNELEASDKPKLLDEN